MSIIGTVPCSRYPIAETNHMRQSPAFPGRDGATTISLSRETLRQCLACGPGCEGAQIVNNLVGLKTVVCRTMFSHMVPNLGGLSSIMLTVVVFSSVMLAFPGSIRGFDAERLSGHNFPRERQTAQRHTDSRSIRKRRSAAKLDSMTIMGSTKVLCNVQISEAP